jgi:hypothetical protein
MHSGAQSGSRAPWQESQNSSLHHIPQLAQRGGKRTRQAFSIQSEAGVFTLCKELWLEGSIAPKKGPDTASQRVSAIAKCAARTRGNYGKVRRWTGREVDKRRSSTLKWRGVFNRLSFRAGVAPDETQPVLSQPERPRRQAIS